MYCRCFALYKFSIDKFIKYGYRHIEKGNWEMEKRVTSLIEDSEEFRYFNDTRKRDIEEQK